MTKFSSTAKRFLFIGAATAICGAAQLKSKHAYDDFEKKPAKDLEAFIKNYRVEQKRGKIHEDNLHIDSVSGNILYTEIGPIKCPLWDFWQTNTSLLQGDSTIFIAFKKVANSYESVVTPQQYYQGLIMNGRELVY